MLLYFPLAYLWFIPFIVFIGTFLQGFFEVLRSKYFMLILLSLFIMISICSFYSFYANDFILLFSRQQLFLEVVWVIMEVIPRINHLHNSTRNAAIHQTVLLAITIYDFIWLDQVLLLVLLLRVILHSFIENIIIK